MDERGFKWYEGKHGEHPDTCTCPVCCEKRRKKEEKERFGGKIECPKCGYLSVNYVGRQQRYVCSNPECGISGETLFELSHGAPTLPPRSEIEIPKSPPRLETKICTPRVVPQKERRQKKTSPTLVRVFFVLVLVVIIGFALSKLVPDLRTAISNIPGETGSVDPLALNPAAESYLNQKWGGQIVNLRAEGTSELCYDDKPGHRICDTYVGTNTHVTITNHQDAHNPTMAELLAFLKEDHTENYLYSYPSFVCTDYAVTLHNNAEANGIRCAYVGIEGTATFGHALNAFQTTDEGLVFVDDTGNEYGTGIDAFAKVSMGQEISEVPVFTSDSLVQFSGIPGLGPTMGGYMWW
jgi:hypothetical protein